MSQSPIHPTARANGIWNGEISVRMPATPTSAASSKPAADAPSSIDARGSIRNINGAGENAGSVVGVVAPATVMLVDWLETITLELVVAGILATSRHIIKYPTAENAPARFDSPLITATTMLMTPTAVIIPGRHWRGGCMYSRGAT
jgi:hypothetical protein